jgi:hypothetical protein
VLNGTRSAVNCERVTQVRRLVLSSIDQFSPVPSKLNLEAMSTADPSICEVLPERTTSLLIIAPGKIGESLHRSLQVVSLDHFFPYIALSYILGSPEKDHIITCNTMQIGITKNLHEALQSLRNPDTPCVVWADAICP